MTSLAGRAAAGRSGDAERLGWPAPSPLGLRERRGDLGESGGTAAPPCSIEGSIEAQAPTAPPPLALALCTRLATSAAVSGSESECAKRRSRTPRSAGAPGAGTSGGSCRRSTCSGSALTCAAALRSAGACAGSTTIPYSERSPPLSPRQTPIRSGERSPARSRHEGGRVGVAWWKRKASAWRDAVAGGGSVNRWPHESRGHLRRPIHQLRVNKHRLPGSTALRNGWRSRQLHMMPVVMHYDVRSVIFYSILSTFHTIFEKTINMNVFFCKCRTINQTNNVTEIKVMSNGLMVQTRTICLTF